MPIKGQKARQEPSFSNDWADFPSPSRVFDRMLGDVISLNRELTLTINKLSQLRYWGGLEGQEPRSTSEQSDGFTDLRSAPDREGIFP